MNRQREIELLGRLMDPAATVPGPLGEASMRNPASAYTSSERFERERQLLFRGMPNLVGLTAECPEPGDYLTGDLGGVPVVVIRGQDGVLRGFVNACRHRGASLLEGTGRLKNIVACPYHGWQYGLDGALQKRPSAEPGFDDIPKAELPLLPIETHEQYGLIFARAAPGQPFTVDEALAGAQAELADYGLETYHHFETRTQEVAFNWKLMMDTFTESYHIAWLHKDTISPHYFFNRWIFDSYGPHGLNIGVRRSFEADFNKTDAADRRLLPHTTIQYLLVPNALLCHQIDHFELWRFVPLAVDRTWVSTSLFAPRPPETDKRWNYWKKNLDLLLHVTNTEDFPLMTRIQQNLASGALPDVVYGKMGPRLYTFIRRSMRAWGHGEVPKRPPGP